jgi:hypothetical protein
MRDTGEGGGAGREVSSNPTRSVPDWRITMPLAHASPRCGARTRAGIPCKGPAMPTGRCRMHGGASPGAPRGTGNGMWKHGMRSTATIERRRKVTGEARRIRSEIRELTRR